MDYFNDVLTTFLGLERVSCVAVYRGSESSRIHQKYLNLCSEDERGITGWTSWRWVINDRIFIFGWTIPLMQFSAFGTICKTLDYQDEGNHSEKSNMLPRDDWWKISVMVLLHRVWKKHPVQVDFLGIYMSSNNKYSTQVHGLIGKLLNI